MNRTTLGRVVMLMGLLIAFGSLTASAQAPVKQKVQQKLQQARKSPAFSYDKAAIPKAKPWTAKKFKNKPRNFQFAIIGDRTGGANVEGTFKLAIDQLNLLQPRVCDQRRRHDRGLQ